MIQPIIPINNYGRDYMACWDNFLTDAEINLLLSQPEWLTATQATVGQNDIDTNVRETHISWLGQKPGLEIIWAKISKVVADVNRRYFQFDLTGIYEPMQLGIYSSEKSGHYDWHIDHGIKDSLPPRKLSIALTLSDSHEYEGGEFQVKITNDEPLILDTKRGRAWFFPSYTLHRVTPVTKGIRRSIVIWVSGPAFK
jgi:PKHD-type hydroxylase